MRHRWQTHLVALAVVGALSGCGQSPSVGEPVSDTPDPTPPTDNPTDPQEPGGAPLRFSGTAPSVETIGPYAVSEAIDYRYTPVMATQNVDADGLTVSQYPDPIDVLGAIRYPMSGATPEPTNGFPVILFQHGRHSSCSTTGGPDGSESSGTDCAADGLVPIRSDLGYDYIASTLASHGYVVLSIDVNDINAQDSASNDQGITSRAELILHHLDIFRAINLDPDSPFAADTLGNDFSVLSGRMDFTRVGLMGHSRGGNGVSKTVTYNRDNRFDDNATPFDDPHDVIAVFALAPTDFDDELPTNVAFATLAPYCDGDVSTLHGTYQYDNVRYVDSDTAGPQFQINALGANHNFYNDFWFNDDAALNGFDPYCTADSPNTGRFVRSNQRRHGAFFIASFLRLYAGGETQFAGYWNARERVPDDACPDALGPCDERFHMAMHRPDRIVVDTTLTDTSLTANSLDMPTAYNGFSQTGWCAPNGTSDPAGLFAGLVPDTCPSTETISKAPQVWGRWIGSPSITYALSDTGLDASDMDFLSVRMGVAVTPENQTGQDFTLTLTDANGVSAAALASDYSDALYFPPGLTVSARSTGAKTVMNMVPFRLDAQPWADSGLDFSQLIEARIDFDQTPTGTIQLTDVLFQRVDPRP